MIAVVVVVVVVVVIVELVVVSWKLFSTKRRCGLNTCRRETLPEKEMTQLEKWVGKAMVGRIDEAIKIGQKNWCIFYHTCLFVFKKHPLRRKFSFVSMRGLFQIYTALICLTRRLKSVAISSPLQIFLPSLLDKVSSHCCILLEFAFLLISAFQRLSNSIFPCSLFCSSLRNADIDTVSRGKTAVLLDFVQMRGGGPALILAHFHECIFGQ